MKNENMGAEDLYLAPEETNDTGADGSSNISESTQSDIFNVNTASDKPQKPVRIKEIPEQRGDNFKVFRMSDGTEQAIFSPSPIHVFDDETHTFEDIESTLTEDEDGIHFTGGKNCFVAKFSREEDNDDIFSIEQSVHKVTVCARKNKKNKNKGVKPHLHKHFKEDARVADILTFADIEPDTDYEYSVEGNGVKENIVIKKPAAIYRYPFALRCANVTAEFDEETKRVTFISSISGEEVFFIPAPFMSDANGMTSANVHFEVKDGEGDTILLTVTADADWINSPARAFPVTIDPQICISGVTNMTTYSWDNGSMFNAPVHTVGTSGMGDGLSNAKRMYINFNMPLLPRNPRIKKAEVVFFQHSCICACNEYPKFGLYHVDGDIALGNTTPVNDTNLIDFAAIKTSTTADGTPIKYTFDITSLIDQVSKNEIYTKNLVMKMLDESNVCSNGLTLYGSSDSNYHPQIVITYESSYGVNTSYRTHTHELGRFGQGSVDLQCGNLMFEAEDFAWSGNRMPVTIKHLFNSALSDCFYTNNSNISLATADFSAMKLGYGFKLNVMQSMVRTSFVHEGESFEGYVYIGENGEETYFKKSPQQECCDGVSGSYDLYEDVNGGDMIYYAENRRLKIGEDTYRFDAYGRLITILDEQLNRMNITYTSNRITSVTDGAGREFSLVYNANGYLTAIVAPDLTRITYTYTGDLLTGISYPDGKEAVIAYSSNKPTSVTLRNANGNQTYKVVYSFSGDRLASVTEYGSNNAIGASSTYSYSAASSRTVVTTTEQMDADAGESENNVITTTYTFDDDGNIVSEYVYSTDTGSVGGDGEASGINPYSGDGGAGIVSNINNLLINHSFETLSHWSGMSGNCGDFSIDLYENESYAKFGKNVYRMQSHNDTATANGVFQVTNTLPAGQYTFSAYLRVDSEFSGTNAGAFIRVTDTSGNILGVSERLSAWDNQHTRLIVPFELDTAQSVQVQILVNGKGTVCVDAAQLENNPYANSYNMLVNGNFERSTSGWTCSGGVYSTTGTRFNMSKSLCMSGSVDSDRHAYQELTVRSTRSTRETFTLSGWAKGYGLPTHDREGIENAPNFRLRAVIKYNDSAYKEYDTEEFTADFSPCTEEWQFASVQFSKSKYRKVESIKVYCEYGYNDGTVHFDDIQLVRNSLETGLAASDFVLESSGGADDEDVESTDTDTTPTFYEAKDRYGNALTETTFTDGEFGTIYRSFKFNDDDDGMAGNDSGNNLIEETDARGNKTTYTVDGDTSRNSEVIDRCGNKTAYEYDDSGRTTKVTSKDANNNTLAHVSYAYDTFDNMTEIARGDGMKYALAYNEFHNLESIGVDGKSEKLITYTYKNGNGRLKQMTYANGDTIKATYNSIGQMVGEAWYNKHGVETARYKYVYDGEENIVRSIDISAQKEYNYEYEEGRIIRATESDIVITSDIVTSKTVVNTIKYYYDNEGKMTKKIITPTGGDSRIIYYETTDDNTTVKLRAGSGYVTSHSKTDSFGRKEFDELQLGGAFISRRFLYHDGEVTDTHKEEKKVKSSPITQLVKQIILSDDRTISYEYDKEERITKVTDSIDGVTEYTYDALGQLLTETVNGVVVNSMTYDNYGNIVSKNGKQYVYDDPVWKDLLTCYDGQAITYDAQGNPVSYLGHSLAWEKGRQLKRFDSNTYTYNANGIRTSKTVNGVTHTYTLDGTKILREVWGDNTLVPLYDNEDGICGITYNDVPYFFIKNLQGDVIAIVDKEAQTVARYSYDAWGAVTSAITYTELTKNVDIATINPFRYRCYYYDEDTGLYYLQSRYCNPMTGRLINEDEAAIFVFAKNPIRTNLYAYCNNSPVNDEDSSGYAVGDCIHAIGIQIAVKIGCVPIGIEFLWSTKTWKPTVFVFAGVAWSANPSKGYNVISDWIYPMFKNISKSASAVMKVISKSNLSISFIGVFGSKKQVFPAGYCGQFSGFSASIRIFWINVAFSAAIGKNSNGVIGSVGLGVSITNGFSVSKTYYAQFTGKDAKVNNLTTLFDTLRSKIKSYMDKFKAIAKFIC